jgi:hypothetical protein
MIRYLILTNKKKSFIRVVRYRGPHTAFRFPYLSVVANGFARCVKDARTQFYKFNAKNS